MNDVRFARGNASGEMLRWLCSFGCVLALHGGAVALALNWQSNEAAPGAPQAALLINLAPSSPAPPPVAESVPQAPPLESPRPEAEPEPENLPEPEVALPAPPPEPPEEVAEERVVEELVTEEQPAPTEPVTHASPSHPSIAAQAAAPQQGESRLVPGAVENWQAQLLAHLEKHKRYPREAQWLKQEGVVELYFAMDRAGRILDARIEASSQSAALDREGLELLTRAQPLPLPQEELLDAQLVLIVPVQFALKR